MSEMTMFPVQDPVDPYRVHILRGSGEAILALQTLLKDRFQDGRNLGRAEMTEPSSADPGPEERGETPLPMEMAG